MRLQLTHAMNTWNPALNTLVAKGYRVWVEEIDVDRHWYCADKDGRRFNSQDPVSLLGLVAIWEQYGDDWQRGMKPNRMDEIFEEAFPDEPG